jgi:hypothetical protein
MSNPLDCEAGRRLAEGVAISARLYADSAAQFGRRAMSRIDRVRLLALSEQLLRRAASAHAELKNHIDRHESADTCQCVARHAG